MFTVFIQCQHCQYRKNIINDFTSGRVTIRYLIEELGYGCFQCTHHDALVISIEVKKEERE